MQHPNSRRKPGPLYPSFHKSIAVTLVLALAACGGKPSDAQANGAKQRASPATASARIVACALMPTEEMNAIAGESYTTAESNDDGRSSESSCHYSTETDPAGMSLSIDWINPRDYSSPAEHAALQKASMGGATLAGKLTAGMVGTSIPGVPNGPVAGVGDEAAFNMLLLTARKGDYTVMVQIIPANMVALMTDSTAAIAFAEKEKAVARKVLAKL